MHICYVTPEYLNFKTMMPFDGGLANYLCKITTYLASNGHHISVICTDADETKELSYKGVKVFLLGKHLKKTFMMKIMKLFLSRTKQDYVYYYIHKKIREIHKVKKIDIIQYASYLAMGKFPEKDIPSCVRVSSYEKLWQKYYEYHNPTLIANEVTMFKKSKFIYSPSNILAQYIKNDLNLSAEIKVIETPFLPTFKNEDKELYALLKKQMGGGKPYLLFFGSLGLLKGAQEIADIVFEVLNKYKTLYLVLVGKEMPINGKSPLEMIKNNAKQHAERVIYFNKTTHDKLFPLIKGCKAVLLPSRMDNLPNCCIESMGLSKIVIGSRGASFEQLIEDEKNGFLCQACDPKSILVAVDKLMALSASEIKTMESEAFAYSQKLYPEIIVPKVLKFYEYVIEKWSNK